MWLLKLTEYLPVSYAAMWKNSSLAWNIKKTYNMYRRELRVTNYASLKLFLNNIYFFKCAMQWR